MENSRFVLILGKSFLQAGVDSRLHRRAATIEANVVLSSKHQKFINVSKMSTLKTLFNNACLAIIDVSSMLRRLDIVDSVMNKPVF